MIRVHVPIDLHAVTCSGSGAFALTTPVRVRDLVSWAVREAIGTRAPQDKYARSVRATLAGLAAGRFTVHVDGRAFDDEDDVVMCGNVADIRFFMRAARPMVCQSELA